MMNRKKRIKKDDKNKIYSIYCLFILYQLMSSDLTNKLSSIIIKRFQTTSEAFFLYSAVLAL